MATVHEALTNFATAITGFLTRQAVAIDGVVLDIANMKKMIDDLQNNPVSSDDQGLLDSLQELVGAAADRAEALDAMTPPPSPVVPAP